MKIDLFNLNLEIEIWGIISTSNEGVKQHCSLSFVKGSYYNALTLEMHSGQTFQVEGEYTQNQTSLVEQLLAMHETEFDKVQLLLISGANIDWQTAFRRSGYVPVKGC